MCVRGQLHGQGGPTLNNLVYAIVSWIQRHTIRNEAMTFKGTDLVKFRRDTHKLEVPVTSSRWSLNNGFDQRFFQHRLLFERIWNRTEGSVDTMTKMAAAKSFCGEQESVCDEVILSVE